MPSIGGGNRVPEIMGEEHHHDALAKRVLLTAFDGAAYPIIASEPYGTGNAKDGLAVVVIDGNTGTYADWGGGGGGGSGAGVEVIATLMTSAHFSVGTSTVGGPASEATRKKILFQADPANTAPIYILQASTASYQLGLELEAGDVFSDSRPYAYTGTYWLRSGASAQELLIREWL